MILCFNKKFHYIHLKINSDRNQALNFWSDECRINVEPCSKITAILQQLYVSHVTDEDKFPANIVTLMLRSASHSPDFEATIFKHQLAECKFQVRINAYN